MIDRVQQKLRTLSGREKYTLMLGAIFLAGLVLWIGLISPLISWVNANKMTWLGDRGLFIWMENTTQEITMLQQGQPKAQPVDNLLALLAQSLKVSPCASSLRSIQQGAQSGTATVDLEGVSFDAFIGWLANFQESYAVKIKSVTVERMNSPGQAKVQVLFGG